MFEPPNPSGLVIALAIVVPMAIVLALRKMAPDRRWLAMFLAVMFGPYGHLYLRGAARYVLLMYAAWLGLLLATPLPPLVSGVLIMVLSALLMNVRLRNAG